MIDSIHVVFQSITSVILKTIQDSSLKASSVLGHTCGQEIEGCAQDISKHQFNKPNVRQRLNNSLAERLQYT